MTFIVGTWNPYTWVSPWPYSIATHRWIVDRYTVGKSGESR